MSAVARSGPLQPVSAQVYFCNGGFSTQQGWVEGALESAHRVLSERGRLELGLLLGNHSSHCIVPSLVPKTGGILIVSEAESGRGERGDKTSKFDIPKSNQFPTPYLHKKLCQTSNPRQPLEQTRAAGRKSTRAEACRAPSTAASLRKSTSLWWASALPARTLGRARKDRRWPLMHSGTRIQS